jgi:uncharacterized protein (TIGR02680 family)
MRRWQPLRGGLLNLYFYDHEVFEYEDGRLLLRGNNGSGKSRVLALQLPFLLDAETRPERLEPDGDPAKRIEWHLLMNGRYPDRTGYTWLEFGRLTDEGPEYRTIGCGMHAVQGKGGPAKWFFLTKQRIGEELDLVSAGRAPLTRARLEEAIGTSGSVFESAEKYRAAIDHEFFSLGAHRYRALMDILVALRKPQLSRNLDEDRLSAALSEALPPVSPEILVDVAEAFRGLETDRSELEASRAAAAAARLFLDGYKRYVSVAARRRARDVRTAQSAFEATNRELRAAETDLAAGRASTKRAEQRQAGAKIARASADEAVRALERSPEMRNVQALRDAKDAAERAEKASTKAREQYERADASVRDHRARSESARRELEKRRDSAQDAVTKTATEATSAVLPRVAREVERLQLDPVVPDAVAKCRKLVERELSERRDQLKTLKRLHAEMARLAGEQRRAGEVVANRRTDRDIARDDCVTSRSRRDDACDRLLRDYERWCLTLKVLEPLAVDVLDRSTRAWADTASAADSPVRAAIDECVRAKVEELAGVREQLVARKKACDDALSKLEAEKMELLAGKHREPPRRFPISDAARERGGSPLWAVCDFRKNVPADARARYEAALEASGLLDAWVSPEGLFVTEPDGELYLDASRAPLGQSLADVLRPAIDHVDPRARALNDDMVEAILCRIGDGAMPDETWVASDGRFAIGVVHGAWTKAAAEYVGHGAREEARRARLSALETEIEAARVVATSASDALAAHDERRHALDVERSVAPPDDDLRQAVERVTRDELALAKAEQSLLSAEAALEAARVAFEGARDELSRAAEAVGLGHYVDDLDTVAERTQATELSATQLWGAIDLLETTSTQANVATSTLARAEETFALAAHARDDAATEAAAATARAATLEDTVGRTVTEILGKLASAKQEFERAKEEEEKAQEAVVEAAKDVSKLEERVTRLQQTVGERTTARDSAVEMLLALLRTKVLRVIGEAGISDDDRASTTAAVELARRLEAVLSSVSSEDSDWERVQRDLNARFMELDASLGPHGYRPAFLEEASVRVVRVPFRGQEIDVHELSQTLDDDVASRERILAAREREIIESHLLGEISTHLHHQLRRAEELLTVMNHEIETRPMSTGMKLKFTWQPHPEAPSGFDAIRPRLLATQATWSASERRAIGDFLQQRIGDVRAKQDAGTWREHLAEAFDYRRWHRFGISRYQDGRWQPLTRRTHGTGSGGEKAVALTLPQLAAAAAHYKSASPAAPRLILLDEAFVGVDNDMRGKCFDLLGSFDLDFVMTSEREWGCYPAVSALAIYQLTTRPGIDAVHTTRFVWNGKQLQRDEERRGS